MCLAKGEAKIPTVVEFEGNKLIFASEGNTSYEEYQEYIPPDETLQTWTKLASIRRYPKLSKPMDYAQTLAQNIKKQYPDSPCAILQNKKSNAVIIDFVVWPEDAAFVEFNVFKIQKSGRNGLVAHQYAERAYSQQKEYLLSLKTRRQEALVHMIDEGLKVRATSQGTTARSDQNSRLR